MDNVLWHPDDDVRSRSKPKHPLKMYLHIRTWMLVPLTSLETYWKRTYTPGRRCWTMLRAPTTYWKCTCMNENVGPLSEPEYLLKTYFRAWKPMENALRQPTNMLDPLPSLRTYEKRIWTVSPKESKSIRAKERKTKTKRANCTKEWKSKRAKNK